MAKTFTFEEAAAPATFSFEEALGPAEAGGTGLIQSARSAPMLYGEDPINGAMQPQSSMPAVGPQTPVVTDPSGDGSVLKGVKFDPPDADPYLNRQARDRSVSPQSKMFTPAQELDRVDAYISRGEKIQAALKKAGYSSVDEFQAARQRSLTRQRIAEELPVLSGIASGAANQIAGLVNFPQVMAEFVNKVFVDPVLTAIGGSKMPSAPKTPGTESLMRAAADYMPKVGKKEFEDVVGTDEFRPWLIANMAQNSPQMVMSLASMLAPAVRPFVLPGMGATSAGNAYLQGDDPRVAMAKGAVEVGSEMLPLGVFDKIQYAIASMPRSAQKRFIADVGKRVMSGGEAVAATALTGGAEEWIAQYGGNVLDKYAQGKNIPLDKGAAGAYVLGAAMGTGMGMPHIISAMGDQSPQAQAERELAALLNGGQFSDLRGDEFANLNPNLAESDPGPTSSDQPASAADIFAQRWGKPKPAVPDPVATVQSATSIDGAITAAAQAVDAAFNERDRQQAKSEQAVSNIARILGTEIPDVGTTAAVPGVVEPADGGGTPDGTPGVGAGVGAAGAAGQPVDAGGVGGQPAGGAVSLGAGQPGALNFAQPPGPVRQITVTPAGTLTAIGDPKALVRLLKSAGVTNVIPATNGITVGKSQASMARQVLDDFVAAPPENFEQDFQQELEREYQADIKAQLLAKRNPQPVKVEKKTQSPLRTMLRTVGIKPELAADITGERNKVRANNVLPFTFRKNGAQIDELVRIARERGFLTQDEDDISAGRRLVEMIQADLRGDRQESTETIDDAMRGEQDADIARAAARLGLDTSGMDARQVGNAVNRIERRLARARADGIRREAQAEARIEREAIQAADRRAAGPDRVLDDLDDVPENATLEDAMRALGFTEQEITDAVAQESRRAQADRAGSGGAVAPAAGPAQGSDRRGESQARQEAGGAESRPQDLLGDAPNASQQAAARLRAEREEQDRRRQQDAPSPDDFMMSGSDRAADVGDAAGQGDLLATSPVAESQAPAPAAKAAAAAPAPAEKPATKIEDDAGNVAMFSRGTQLRRGDPTTGRELRVTEIQKAVSRLTAGWLRQPDIHILDSMEDAPGPVREVWQRQNSQGGTGAIEGFHYRGGVYLLANALVDEADVRRVLFHEALGHWGLRNVWGDDLKPILAQLATMRPQLIRAKAKQYGLDMKNENERLMAAEEVLAEMAQTRPEIGWVRRAIAAIRRWLRAHGVSLGLSDNDIIANYILPARGWVERGRQSGPSSVTNAAQFARTQRQTDTPAFRKWFGDSVVTDNGKPMSEGGKPLVVYHGTDSVFTEFSRTGDIGHHFGTEIAARDRAARVGGAEVLVEPVTLSQVEKDSLSSLNGEIGGTPAADLYALLLRKLDSPRQNLRAQVEAMPADEIKKVKAEYLEQPDSLRFAERVDRAKAGEGFRVEVNGETVSTHRTVREANARAARLRERAATPMALYLRIENPIRLPDLGVWPAQEIAKEAGFSKREMERVVEAGTAEQQYEAVRAILESKGFDGIVYRNEVEHAGEDSYIAFRPEQIKSAIGNSGAFDPENPDILADRTGMPDAQRIVEPWQVGMAPSLATALRRWTVGKTADTDLAAAVQAELDERKAKREAATDRDRVRGADWFRERLLRARRTGELSTGQVDLAMWMLNQAPQLATDLGISIKAGNEATPNGTYNTAERVVTIFANRSNENTATHEILHHAERMMPAEVQDGIRREWLNQLERGVASAKKKLEADIQSMADEVKRQEAEGSDATIVKQNMAEQQERVNLLNLMLMVAQKGDPNVAALLWQNGQGDVNLRRVLPYELSQPSEFWAVNGARLMRKQAEAEGSWVAKARQWLRGIVEQAKSLLGLPSDAKVLRGLRAVMAGDGSFVTRTMLTTRMDSFNDETARYALGGGMPLFGREARMPSGLTMQDARDRIREMRGADIGQVRAIVDSIRKTWKGGPSVEVVASYRDLPGRPVPGARGMYIGGKVYVVASSHRAGGNLRQAVAKTLSHEVIAHYGLRKILGADFDRLLTKPLQLAIASGNKPMTALRDQVRRLYVDEDGNFTLTRREEADEIAARAVENAIDEDGNFRPGYSWLKSVWARVAQFLRDMGVDVQFTNAELQGMLVQALRAVESGDRFNGGGRLVVGGDAAAREARAFHGTPHRGIEKFSTDKIGTGEGAQAFGWGLYFASRREIAEHYRNKLSKRTAGHNTIDGKRITDKVLEQLRNDADPYVSGFFRSRDGARAKGVTSIVKAVQDAIESATEFRDEYQGRLDSYLANPPVASTYKPDDYRGFIAQFDKKIAGLQALQKRVQYVAPRINGQLYEVEIPEDSEMLLWDKPMSEQPALSVSKVFNQGWQHALYRVNGSKDVRDFTGAELYRALSVQMGGDRAASDALASLGIKGIKYLDGVSRNKSLRDVKREFLSELPEDADFDEVMDLIGSGTFSPKNEAILKALADNDWLGFDYPAQAISAALSGQLGNYDASPTLVQAVADAQDDGSYNYVIFSGDDVAIQAALYARGEDQTNTPAFRKWFGDSKVVDGQGRPLVVYRGSPRGETDNGTYFTDSASLAGDYARSTFFRGGDSPAVMPAFLALSNPLVIDAQGKRNDNIPVPWQPWKPKVFGNLPAGAVSVEGAAAWAKEHGHNGLIVKNVVDDPDPTGRSKPATVYVAFRPEQIKSAIGNRGTFDAENPDIRYALAANNNFNTNPTSHPRSRWLDDAGRLRFLPGTIAYDLLGKAATPLLNRVYLKTQSKPLRRAIREMKLTVQKAQDTAEEIGREVVKLTDAEREMVSDIIEKELATGVIPPAHAVKLAATMNEVLGKQSDELVELGMLASDTAEQWRGKYLARYYKDKLGARVQSAWDKAISIFGAKPMRGLRGNHFKGRGLYETIPESELPVWEANGWEVRDPDYQEGITKDGTVRVWRDFTRAEREKMGEIRDAGFRFVMGYMETQKDIALGRMFQAIAADPELSSKYQTEELSEQVPDGTISGTGVKKYGKLAGRWVSKETISHLSQIEESQSEAFKMYRKAMGLWKETKTSLNPVSHANNIVSNITMAHFAGVSYWDGHKYAQAMRDFATKSASVQEAKDAGLFLGTVSDAELMNVLPEDLKAIVRQQEGAHTKVGRTAFNAMTWFLRRPMGAAYQAEDTFFRYLIWKDARDRGMSSEDAVDYSLRYIFAYDDLPRTARYIRDFGIPFFAYTYKAIPALLHTAANYPWRFAAPAAVMWGVNAAAYAIAVGDDDDDWIERLQKYLTDPAYREKAKAREKLEREYLPEWMKGKSIMGTPKAIRLGMDEVTKLPLFIDVYRMVPGGDMLDMNNNAGGTPWLQPFTPNHPLLTTYMAMFGNRDGWTGKDVVDKTDDSTEAAQKRLGWLWRQTAPALAYGNYHFERTMQALAQATGKPVQWAPEFMGGMEATGVGKDGLPVQPKYAAMQTFGLKVRPIDVEMGEIYDNAAKNKLIREIDAEMRRLGRLNAKGAVSDANFDREAQKANVKRDRINDGLTIDGKPKN